VALSSATVASLLQNVTAAGKAIDHLSPFDGAMDEDYWASIQQAFSVTRGIINLNNGGVSPSPRMVTEAFVRYTWQQEDATAYTMWQILEPQSETVRTGLAEVFGCDPEEIAITRNASESLEILLMGMDLKSGDEIIVPKSGLNIVQHHALYLGLDEQGTDWIIENAYGVGVRLVTADNFFKLNPHINEIRIFTGDSQERRQLVERALRKIGQPYNLIDYNCQHFTSEIKTRTKRSRQVETAVVRSFVVLLIGALIFD